MSKSPDDMKSPLARARGLGSAHEGVHHWLHQRITAIALVPLMVWLVVSIVSLNDADYGVFTGWIAQPVNAILLIFVIIAGFYHAALGLQVVLEDYISCKATRIASIIANKLFFLGAGLASVFSILKIAL